jgi:hypothetical protein
MPRAKPTRTKESEAVPRAVLPYLTTLRRLPDDVVLDIATRDLDLWRPCRCVCGWAVRAGLARSSGDWTEERTGDAVLTGRISVLSAMEQMYGGTLDEWQEVFVGVVQPLQLPLIEHAFVLRLDEAVASQSSQGVTRGAR